MLHEQQNYAIPEPLICAPNIFNVQVPWAYRTFTRANRKLRLIFPNSIDNLDINRRGTFEITGNNYVYQDSDVVSGFAI